MKAEIMMHNWKLEIFRKLLDKADFEYTVEMGITKDTLTLIIEYGVGMESFQRLKSVVEFPNTETARKRMH